MKVYVVMGNDFPEAVFDDDVQADKFVDAKKIAEGSDPDKHPHRRTPRIHWRVYPFDLQGKA